MPANTPNYAFTYPVLSDTPNGAGEIQTFATQVDNALAANAASRPKPLPAATVGTTTWNGTALFTVSIPDPGYAYYIDIEAYATAPSVAGVNYLQLIVHDTTISGTNLADFTTGTSTTYFSGCLLRRILYAGASYGVPFTGAKTLVVGALSSVTTLSTTTSPRCTGWVVPA